jgi:hypothetical protein
MSTLLLALPLPPGGAEKFEEFVAQVNAKLDEHTKSRADLGVTQEICAIQVMPDGGKLLNRTRSSLRARTLTIVGSRTTSAPFWVPVWMSHFPQFRGRSSIGRHKLVSITRLCSVPRSLIAPTK